MMGDQIYQARPSTSGAYRVNNIVSQSRYPIDDISSNTYDRGVFMNRRGSQGFEEHYASSQNQSVVGSQYKGSNHFKGNKSLRKLFYITL